MDDEAIRSVEDEIQRSEHEVREWDEEEEEASPEFHDQYAFNENQHMHTLNGKALHGVTTVLQVISKPALIQWAADQAIATIKEKAVHTISEIPPLQEAYYVSPALLEEARYAHRRKKEKAGDWGTLVHKAVEVYVSAKMGKPIGNPPLLDEKGNEVLKKFKDWAESNKIRFLESEKHVWSKKLCVGGILDLVFEMDGKTYVGDIKTSTGIYDEAFYQMAAYDLCLKEMTSQYDIDGYIVINLRKDGKMDLKMAENLGINREAFLAALTLHKIKQSIL